LIYHLASGNIMNRNKVLRMPFIELLEWDMIRLQGEIDGKN